MTTSPQSSEDLDRAFQLLAHPIRRQILLGLHTENEFGIENIDAEGHDPQRLEIELHHHHLPKLAASNYVEVDGKETVRRGPAYEDIAPLLGLLDEYGEEPVLTKRER